MLSELRTLDPRPGQAFDYEPIQPVGGRPVPAAPGQGCRHRRRKAGTSSSTTDALPKVLVDRKLHAHA